MVVVEFRNIPESLLWLVLLPVIVEALVPLRSIPAASCPLTECPALVTVLAETTMLFDPDR